MSKVTKAVIPFSGGMDSTTLFYHAYNNFDFIYPISINYGQRHLYKELNAINHILNNEKFKESHRITHKILDLTFFRDIAGSSALTNNNINVAKAKDVMGDPQTVNYVPFRNMMILSICSAYAETVGADTVFHGAAQADSVAGYWDGSKEFVEAINNVNNLNRRHKIKIEAPLLSKSKADIIKWGIEMGVDYSKTWTCYEGKEEACGTCTACSLRLKGFIDAGYKDPVMYSVKIPWPVGVMDLTFSQ
jgi:7-cyano-7-deazaguanine synthase